MIYLSKMTKIIPHMKDTHAESVEEKERQNILLCSMGFGPNSHFSGFLPSKKLMILKLSRGISVSCPKDDF